MLGAARDLLRPNASKRWWRALPGYNSKQQRGNADLTYGVMVIDMGVHELSGMDTPICLTQVRSGGGLRIAEAFNPTMIAVDLVTIKAIHACCLLGLPTPAPAPAPATC